QALHDARTSPNELAGGQRLRGSELDALEAEIELASGRRGETWRSLTQGLRSLGRALEGVDAGPYSDLALGRGEGLRGVGLRLLSDDARESYRFELGWRSLPALLGRKKTLPSNAPPLPALDSGGRSIHLVYAFTSEGLVRWTRSSGAVRREVLCA